MTLLSQVRLLLNSSCCVPDVAVTCFHLEDCVLPCAFQPGGNETVAWFRQDALLYRFDRNGSKESLRLQQLAPRASITPQQISEGNASLVLRRAVTKDRGIYRCHVQTSAGEHKAKVILKVIAPIQGLFLEHFRLSGNEEIKCSVQDVFPAPRVTWATEPPTFENLRPITRIQTNHNGLFSVESRLEKLKGRPDFIYVCKMTSSYDASAWTSSLREREIRGPEGRDLTLQCQAPTYLNKPALYWTFSRDNNSTLILSYDSRSGRRVSLPSWDSHVELYNKPEFRDGSLRLMDPKPSEHSGTYTCEFSVGHSKHIERIRVTIGEPPGPRSGDQMEKPSYWWIFGVVAAVLVLVLVGVLAFLKLRGRYKKPRGNPEEETELNRVKDKEVVQ
uniref:Ig-like domain-containing protein n=1 Tax=Fundulus heteroclitus TaxID=8078 RepID=A0A3Q2QJQ8_FUNHE